MKTFKYICLGFIPFILALLLENGASVFMMGLSLIFNLQDVVRLFSMSPQEALTQSMQVVSFALLLYSCIAIILYSFWYQRCGSGVRPAHGNKRFRFLFVIAAIVIVPAAQFITGFIINFITLIQPSTLQNYIDMVEQAGLDNPGIPMLIYASILGPIAEELIFRGVTMKTLLKGCPFWAANLIQAILFGVFHMNLMQGIYAFALGLLLGLICMRFGSIYYSILTHILFNCWGTLVTDTLTSLPEIAQNLLVICGTLASLALFLIFYILGRKQQKQQNVYLS